MEVMVYRRYFFWLSITIDGNGNIEIVRDYNLSEFAKSKISITATELLEEKDLVKDLI
ncbi:MAG: hypothetical protein Ct9H90mP22_4600 [Gammaproteobacteria bacterium]|nr:MAG: hypothetical protein Ct9H90mP22_4600 [Gammaproteobacteria bacterium]